MPKPYLNPDYFLNRTALVEMCNPRSVNPDKIIRSVFEFADLDTLLDLFRKYCEAALSQKFAWKDGSPGNLFFISNKLEQLIEACFLIQEKPARHIAMSSRKSRPPDRDITGKSTEFSETGRHDSQMVIEDFFTYQGLAEWKAAIYMWTEAGLSNFSVTESVDPAGVLGFHQHMEKLIKAASRISPDSGGRTGKK